MLKPRKIRKRSTGRYEIMGDFVYLGNKVNLYAQIMERNNWVLEIHQNDKLKWRISKFTAMKDIIEDLDKILIRHMIAEGLHD